MKLIGDMLKAQGILRVLHKDVSQRKIAKLLGNSQSKIRRDMKSENIVIDSIFGVVKLDDLSNMMMNTMSPVNGLNPLLQSSTTPSTTGVVHSTGTYILPLCAREVSHSINELLIGHLELPILDVPIAIDFQITRASILLGLLLIPYLIDNGDLHQNSNTSNHYRISSSLIQCFVDICRSDSILTDSLHYRALIEHDKKYVFAIYFERYGSYRNGIQGYKYRLLPSSLELISKALMKFSELEFVEVAPIPSDILLPKSLLHTLKPQDVFYMLSHCKGTHDDCCVIENIVQDSQCSRKYSVMTSISSSTRHDMDFVGYDISACLQTIALGVLGASNYPVHSMLMRNKTRFRNVIAKRLNKKVVDVKTILTAGDNGKQYRDLRKKSKLLDKYLLESETMAVEFNEWMKATNPERYANSNNFAKDDWVGTGKYNQDNGQPLFEKSGEKNKYSLFFFNWTQIERDIRDVMIACADDGIFVHEVHDAIYIHQSEVQPKIEDMQQAIAEQLGLNIKIESV